MTGAIVRNGQLVSSNSGITATSNKPRYRSMMIGLVSATSLVAASLVPIAAVSAQADPYGRTAPRPVPAQNIPASYPAPQAQPAPQMQPAPQPVYQQPAPQPAPQPQPVVAAPEPQAKPKKQKRPSRRKAAEQAQPVAQPEAQPVAQPMPQPQPVVQPAPEPVVQPAAQPAPPQAEPSRRTKAPKQKRSSRRKAADQQPVAQQPVDQQPVQQQPVQQQPVAQPSMQQPMMQQQPMPQPVPQQPMPQQPMPQPMAQPMPSRPMTAQEMRQAQQAAINKALGIEQSNVRFGVALFPSAPPPADSCIAKAGPVGDTSAFATAIDGSKLKKPDNLEGLRKKQKTGTIFVRGVNFEGASFQKVDLQDFCFIDANLRYTDWSNVRASGLGFVNADLTGAKLINGQLPYVLLRDAILADVNATGANISGGRLDGGWKGSMRNLNLNTANLTGFRVECGYTSENGCPFDRQGLKLRGANMTKASFYAFDFPDVDIADAIMDQTEIGLQHVARMSGAKLVGPMVVRGHNSAAIYLPAEYAMIRRALMTGIDGMASFDCAGNQTVIKKAICTSSGSELRRLDREVAQLDQDILRRNRAYGADRTAWDRSVEAKCATLPADDIADCLKGEYRSRREALISRAGAPDWMKPGSYALFIASEAPISPEFLKSELFLRVRPVLFDSAPSKVMVQVDRNGRMTAKGDAMGVCQLRGSDLSYDRATGWVTGGGTVGTKRRPGVPGTQVFRAVGDELKIFQDGVITDASGASVAGGNPYFRCGPNGSFTMMQLVPLPQSELAQIWELVG